MPATEQRVALPSRYRVIRHIAHGGMASVWAAEDQLLGRLVAVKLLSRAYDTDERARRRFLREARAAARLGECRHVVTVYDIGEHDDRAFMVMEYFAGGTVADRLRRGGAIPRPLALRWLRETAIALDCAHEHDVVHRDVKPANLLLDEHGRLAVGDFGIATVASDASVTQTGQVLGTAAYISPEQARGLPATAASDRYALGVVAFELLTGARPFTADHPAAQARAHVQATVPDASAATHDLPPAVDAVLRDGMAKEPEARPATAEELVDRLEAALGAAGRAGDEPTATTRRLAPAAATVAGSDRRRPEAHEERFRRAAAPPPGPPRPAPPAPRRWSWVLALGALLLAAGAVAAIALTGGGGGDRASAPSTNAGRGPRASARHSSGAAPKRRSSRRRARAGAQRASAQTQTSTAQSAAPAADPKALNAQGFALIQQGNPAGAVPLLQQSVQGFRQQRRTGEIDYAFALYNLATALRRTGHPADAIPLLMERLQVSGYKRATVARELALARQQAGQGAGAPAAGSGKAGKDKPAKNANHGDEHGGGGHGGDGDGGDD